MQFADFTFGKGDDADAGKAHPLVKPGDIFLVARKAVERFRQDDVEAPLQSVGDEFLDTRTDQRGTGDGAIGIAVDNCPAFTLSPCAAGAKLVLDRGITLVVGGLAGVKSNLHEMASLFEEAFAGGTLLFGFDEFTGCLSRKQADKFPEARIGF
jgi:hypothetical protein